MDGRDPKVESPRGFAFAVLDFVIRLGFAAFITVGFAAGLSLRPGLCPSHPSTVVGCGAILLWTFVLIWCMTGQRSSDMPGKENQ